ncbi:MAG: hypothetical protein PHF31_12050 [Methylobacter sp.]|nr:hypothetical protein [Methylobacter sp.]
MKEEMSVEEIKKRNAEEEDARVLEGLSGNWGVGDPLKKANLAKLASGTVLDHFIINQAGERISHEIAAIEEAIERARAKPQTMTKEEEIERIRELEEDIIKVFDDRLNVIDTQNKSPRSND